MVAGMDKVNLRQLIHAILEEYALPWHGIHGVSHWARVLENGLCLAEKTGANVEVVKLFAVFHDSRRVNEDSDFGRDRKEIGEGIRSENLVPGVGQPSELPQKHEKRHRADLVAR
jgi:HD superfamily phosphodiesterase